MKGLSILLTAALTLNALMPINGSKNKGTEANSSRVATRLLSTTSDGKKIESLTGCVTKSGEANGYVLINPERTVKILSTNKAVADYVGHQVRVEGKWAKRS